MSYKLLQWRQLHFTHRFQSPRTVSSSTRELRVLLRKSTVLVTNTTSCCRVHASQQDYDPSLRKLKVCRLFPSIQHHRLIHFLSASAHLPSSSSSSSLEDPPNPNPTVDNDPQKLAQEIKHILHHVDLGSMTSTQILNAKSWVYHLVNLRTLRGTETAEEILERLVAERNDGGNDQVTVEAKMYNIIIDAYGKCHQDGGVERAEALLERMRQRSEIGKNLGGNEEVLLLAARPDLFSYNSLLNGWSLSRREDAVVKAENILAFLESKDSPVRPNSVTYNIMMNTYANQVGEYGFAQKAEDILLHMTSLQKDGNEAINPDTRSFNIVLKAWKNSGGGVESAQRAEDILRLMIKLYEDGHSDLKPDSVSFRTVIHAYEKHGPGPDGKISADIANRLEGLGEVILDETTDLSRNNQLVSEVMSDILKCLAKSGLPDAGERANRLFQKIQQQVPGSHDRIARTYDDGHVSTMIALLSNRKTLRDGQEMVQDLLEGRSSVRPTTFILNRLLHFYCRTLDVDAAQRIFESMTSLAKEKGYNTLPDVATYNMMVNLYFQRDGENAADLGLRLLDQMEADYRSGTLVHRNDTVYTVLIRKLSKFRVVNMRSHAYDVLMRMIDLYDQGELQREPELLLYNMALSSINNQFVENRAEKALELLHFMQKRVRSGKSSISPDTRTYSHVLAILTKNMNVDGSKTLFNIIQEMEREEERRNLFLFDNIVFETALRGLAHAQYGDGILADTVLKKMFDLHKNGHRLVQPNAMCMNLVIKSQLSENKSSARAMVAFDAHRCIMKFVSMYDEGKSKILPSREGFHTVIASWSDTPHWKSILKAEEIYATMLRLSNTGAVDVCPDSFTNLLMLRLFSNDPRNKSTVKAIKFFKRIKVEHLDAKVYNCMLRILEKSQIKEKVEISADLLHDMECKKIADLGSYNAVLSACATSKGRDNQMILETAIKTHNRLLESVVPDELSFALLMRAWKKLSTDESEVRKNLKILYDDACARGFKGRTLMDELNKK